MFYFACCFKNANTLESDPNAWKVPEKEHLLNKSAKEENSTHVLNHFVMVESCRKDKRCRTGTNIRERNEPRV